MGEDNKLKNSTPTAQSDQPTPADQNCKENQEAQETQVTQEAQAGQNGQAVESAQSAPTIPNKNRSPQKLRHHETLRLIIQCISFAFHNGYVTGWVKGKIYSGDNKMFCVPGLNCYSCPGAIGSCPIGSLQAVLDSGGFRISLYVFGFIGAIGVFCGRFICGWLCPFGLVQDLIYRIPLRRKIKNLPGHRYLRYLRFVILALFVVILPMSIRNQSGVGQPWFCEYICPSGTLLGGIPLTIANAQLRALIGPRFIWKAALLIIILVAALISDRPFCKYICPLGALYGLANPISIYRYRVDKDACTGCGACQKVCGADIKVWQTPNSMDCIRCGKCISACPTGALYTTFSKCGTVGVKGEVTAGRGVNGGKRVGVIISGLICVSVTLYTIYQTLTMLYLIVISQSITNVLSFLQYLMALLIMLVPEVMTLILGLGLLAGVTFRPALYQKLIDWPKRILITTGICAALTYAGYIVISLMMAGQFAIEIFVYAFALCISGLVMGLLVAIAAFIAWLVTKPPKQ